MAVTSEPCDYGLTGTVVQQLVRVDASGADLRALDPTASGDHRVSSADGLDLLAAAGGEARAGAAVGPDWVGSGGQFPDRSTEEATSGTGTAGAPYGSASFLWPSHRYGSTYLSLRRAEQFATVGPGATCQVRVFVTDAAQLDAEPIAWVRAAYDAAR